MKQRPEILIKLVSKPNIVEFKNSLIGDSKIDDFTDNHNI